MKTSVGLHAEDKAAVSANVVDHEWIDTHHSYLRKLAARWVATSERSKM